MKQIFYQNIARKFRPQKFSDVMGQEPIVTTLKNALLEKRLAHAYLFAGSRGCGKTTLARILAKSLCCKHPEGIEPCCKCSSCVEIQTGNSLDVIEIDGASTRGIDDIRALSETTMYAPSQGSWKIYIIDEVHMLTKEAFNALLKTLEEPPERVKFFFATTEPHKILPTILSRCQRFDLARISHATCVAKLAEIAKSLERPASKEALELLAKRAEGSLRDAESLLDQIFSYEQNNISTKTVMDALGIAPKEDFLAFDQAVFQEDYAFAFSFTNSLVERGKDLSYFLEQLFSHFRSHFLDLLQKGSSPHEKEFLLSAFASIQKVQLHFSKVPNQKIAIEMLLIEIIRGKKRVHLPSLIVRLEEIYTTLNAKGKEKPDREEKESAGPTPPAPPSLEKIEQKKKPNVVEVPFAVTAKKPPEKAPSLQKKVRQDTLVRFSSVVLDGRIE